MRAGVNLPTADDCEGTFHTFLLHNKKVSIEQDIQDTIVMRANAVTHLQENFKGRAYRLWNALVTPIGTAYNLNQQRRARLLSVFTLMAAFLFPAIAMLPWVREPMHLPLLAGSVIMVLVFVLNRYNRYRLAALTTVLLINLFPYASAIFTDVFSKMGSWINLVWLSPIFVFTSLILPPRLAVSIYSLNWIILLLLPMVTPWVTQDGYEFLLLFAGVTTFIVLVAAWVQMNQQRDERLQAEQLAEEQQRYRDLFSAGFETLIIHHNGVILDVNPAGEEMFGYTHDEMLILDLGGLFAAESHDVVRSHSASCSAEVCEARGRRKDGSLLWVEIRGKQHQYRGQWVQVAAVRDVTQRRQAEAQRLELTIEQEKVRVLQRFIGDMSHDLRTPLSVMKTSGYLINRLVSQPDKMLHHVETLQTQIDLLQNMFDDLLSMSRLDRADTSEYQFRWLPPDGLVRDLVEEQRTFALRKNISLNLHIETPVPSVLLDQDEFRRMLKHLIINALNYTPEGGKVDVRLYLHENWACLDVSDNGPGIPSLDLPLIFERFYRGDASRRKETGGTGIGLSIVKKIVEAHNGEIDTESELGKGTTFRVRLPAQTVALKLNETANG
jgi:PAS domain S-box-containing protein